MKFAAFLKNIGQICCKWWGVRLDLAIVKDYTLYKEMEILC